MIGWCLLNLAHNLFGCKIPDWDTPPIWTKLTLLNGLSVYPCQWCPSQHCVQWSKPEQCCENPSEQIGLKKRSTRWDSNRRTQRLISWAQWCRMDVTSQGMTDLVSCQPCQQKGVRKPEKLPGTRTETSRRAVQYRWSCCSWRIQTVVLRLWFFLQHLVHVNRCFF